MATLPPKASYKLCIAKSLRNIQYAHKALEEFFHKNSSLYYNERHISLVSNLFNQLNSTFEDTINLLSVDINYGALNNSRYIPIESYKLTISRFKYVVSENIKKIKEYVLDLKEDIEQYLEYYEINSEDEMKENLSHLLSLLDKIKNTLEIEYGSCCAMQITFELDPESDDDKEVIYSGFDYDNENENIEVLRSYCKEVFVLNDCSVKDYNMLIDKSFENGMADAIPIALEDLSKILKNIVIWLGFCDDDNADEYIKEVSFDQLLIELKVRKESHIDEYLAGNRDTYLPISSLIFFWYIIKFLQYNYEHS